jgi:hypothetical protein
MASAAGRNEPFAEVTWMPITVYTTHGPVTVIVEVRLWIMGGGKLSAMARVVCQSESGLTHVDEVLANADTFVPDEPAS